MNNDAPNPLRIENADASSRRPSGLRPLLIIAFISATIYAAISLVSGRFEYDEPTTERPILVVIILFAVLFLAYLVAIRFAINAKQDARLVWLICGAAIIFRATLLFSFPIQEVDIYRYLWDGLASAEGVSPFQYSPEQIATAADDRLDDQLDKLVRLRKENHAAAEILRRVHYRHLPTIYPTTSQAVFYAAAVTTPRNASLMARVSIMKTWLIGFDLGVILLVFALLNLSRMPVGLGLTYAWCPLVMKEIANGGHLDSIAIFFTTLTVYLVAGVLRTPPESSNNSRYHFPVMVLAAITLSVAAGAKLYPVILAPLIFLTLLRRFGWRSILIPLITFSGITLLLLWPILPTNSRTEFVATHSHTQLLNPPPLPIEADAIKPRDEPTGFTPETTIRTAGAADSSLGLTTFLKQWEINDLIFMVIVENLKPLDPGPSTPQHWFSILPDKLRRSIVHTTSSSSGISHDEVPFRLTRLVTSLAFLTLALCLALQLKNTNDTRRFCELTFLTIAWFWLLLPTQNPWYWMWALPLLPFVRNRAWLAVSGLVLFYYLRFWLMYHYADLPVLESSYKGTQFFDFVVVWIEFGPWLVWLTIEWITNLSARVNGD